MLQNYDQALTEVLKSEGGYSNDPGDPGGPTNFGITIADYRRYINSNGTALDVRRMSLADAKRIYKSAYWDALNCDGLPSGVDYCVFDYGVNSGIGRAKKILDRYAAVKDPATLINTICNERMAFLRSLRTFSIFGRGWTARVAHVRQVAIAMAQSAPIPQHITRAWISFGMGGASLDPAGGEAYLVQRCQAIGIDTRHSPYQWNDLQTIANDISLSNTKVIVGGDSLGANSAPHIAALTKNNIDLLFGFQPSNWGEKVLVPANVAVAVCIYNPVWFETLGMGNYPWALAEGNHRTKLIVYPIEAPHPDDIGHSQDIVFNYIKEIHSAH
jgi:lysozyme family protein